MAASERIRASIEALPEHQRVQWDYQIRSLHMDGTSDGRIAPITGGPAIAHIPTGHTGDYIALMGPHVGEKVAALLEAIQRHKDRMHAEGFTICHDPIHLAADALTKAIEGEQR